jgi:hypothetical protein
MSFKKRANPQFPFGERQVIPPKVTAGQTLQKTTIHVVLLTHLFSMKNTGLMQYRPPQAISPTIRDINWH